MLDIFIQSHLFFFFLENNQDQKSKRKMRGKQSVAINCAFLSCICKQLYTLCSDAQCSAKHFSNVHSGLFMLPTCICNSCFKSYRLQDLGLLYVKLQYFPNILFFSVLYLSYLYSMIKSHHGVNECPQSKRKKEGKGCYVTFLALLVTIICSKPNLFCPKVDPFPKRFFSIHCIACNH